MSPQSDNDFVDQLRSMAAATPVIAVPGATTIVRAGRSRIAKRRSIFAGAFGLALMAGAGITTLPQVGLFGPATQPAPIAAVAHTETISPLDSRAIVPMTEPLTEAEPLAGTEPLIESPTAPADSVVEASGRGAADGISPWTTGLSIAGVASLGTAAGLAVRSRRLQPAPVQVR